MKLVRLVLWGIVAIVLIGLLIMGLTGRLSIFSNFNFPFNIGGSIHYANSELYSVGAGNASTQDISSIDIHWVSGDVNVVEYSGDDIEFNESSSYDMDQKDEMRYLVKDGKLIIQFCAPGRLNIFGNTHGKSLTVYVPSDFEMENFTVDAVSASVNAENLTANKSTFDTVSGAINVTGISSNTMRFDMVSGRLDAKGCSAESVTADTVSGGIELQGEFYEIKCDSVSGSTFVSPGMNIREINLDSVSGKVTVEIPEIDGFTARYDSVSGRFNCEFPVTTSKSTVTYGNGIAEFRLDTVSGSINIIKD